MNNEINIELLKNTSNRLIDFLRKNSKLEFCITDTYSIYVYHKVNRSSSIFFKTALNNVQPIIGIVYSFLMNHDVGNSTIDWWYCSIFKYAEACRNYFMKVREPRYIKSDTILHEICYSDAGQIIKNLGFPTILEELALKMDLMGI
jgi:hypothetical protein